jgi:hypothetical protein
MPRTPPLPVNSQPAPSPRPTPDLTPPSRGARRSHEGHGRGPDQTPPVRTFRQTQRGK